MRELITLAIVLATASGCREKRAAPPVEAITIAAATMPNFSMVLVAQAKGYFASEGLAVTLRLHQFGKPALAEVLDDQADLATCAETPVVFAERRGQRLSVLASIASSTRNNAVVARKAAGISTPADLSGKRVGVTRATSGDFFLDTFLLRYGVDRRQVRFVDLKPEEMAEAMARGEVDAVATWTPTTLALQNRFGGQVGAFYVEDLHSETAVLVGRRGFAQRRPEAAKKVLRALLKAEALFREHPDEARRAAATALRDEPGDLDAMLRLFQFRVRLDQGLLVLMEEEARWASRTGQPASDERPRFLEAIEPAPLLAVKPEAVGLIR